MLKGHHHPLTDCHFLDIARTCPKTYLQKLAFIFNYIYVCMSWGYGVGSKSVHMSLQRPEEGIGLPGTRIAGS